MPRSRNSSLATLVFLAAYTICCDVAAPGPREKVFVSDAGRFEVIFSGEPETGSHRREVGPDLVFDMKYFTVQTKSPTAKYSVQYYDVPGVLDGPAEEAFDSVAEGGLEEVGGRELGRKDVKVGEHSGRVLTAAKPDGSFMKVKFILADRRFYQVMAFFPSEGRTLEETTRGTEQLADKFLESFRLLPR